ncbi:MAG TPA: cyclic nucleotide-binding domain-containing protein [Myxococcaceae bacterium]|nr:cyclic nucleotide-binding domain-containing protein [Myxococcaceae bacterium]
MDAEAALWVPPKMAGDAEPDILAALKQVPLFDHLSNRDLKKIGRMLHERTYQPGEVIFREGDPGAGMFIVRKGKVNIVIGRPDGTEQLLTPIGERQFFGEMALLEAAPRSASAVAAEKSELLGFFEPDLESLIERDSKLGSKVVWNLARLMAYRLRGMNETLRKQRQEEAAARSSATGSEGM